ncbi:MAG: YfhO family protein [Flavobacteriales bacterium]|nr:YfhO family protein [Flavobacteriales bacterium]
MKQINWTKVLPHFVVLIIMLVISMIYFYPAFEYSLDTHDITMHKGMSKEIVDYREKYGDEPLWTNSMFGGMPADQISVQNDSNLMNLAYKVLSLGLPRPISTLWILFLGFYILLMCLKIDPWLALVGSIGFGFSTFFMWSMQAGHMSKVNAIGFMAPVIGSFIMLFRGNILKGFILLSFFMAMQLWASHPQITYYTLLVLLFLGVFFIVEFIIKKEFLDLVKRSILVIFAIGLGLMTSLPNLWGTYEYSKHTMRGEKYLTIPKPGTENDSIAKSKDGLDIDYILAWSYGTGETFTFVFPSLKGGGNNDVELKNLRTLFPSAAEKLTENMNNDLSSLSIDELFGQNGINLAEIPANEERGYYGQQGLTNGPVFIGVILCLLTLMGLIFSDGKLNWILFGTAVVTILMAAFQQTVLVLVLFVALAILSAINKRIIWVFLTVTMLAVMLSWGKNYLSFSKFFIDFIPMYSKFRAVTMILVIADLMIPLMGILFLAQVVAKRDLLKNGLMKLYIGCGAIALATILVWMNPTSIFNVPTELSGTGGMYQDYLTNAVSQDPQMKQQFLPQLNQYFTDYAENLHDFRVDIIKTDAIKAFIFILLIFSLLYLYANEKIGKPLVLVGFSVLVLFEMVSVDLKYLNSEKDEAGDFNYWVPKDKYLAPFEVLPGDLEIFNLEVAENPWLADSLKLALSEANSKSDQTLDVKGQNELKFEVLNRCTNFRVANFQGLTSESRTSYFYKSIGGYHGAKLRRIQDIFDFSSELDMEQIINMMNVKYLLQYQNNNQGEFIAMNYTPNPNALGSAWIVDNVKFVDSGNDELMSMKNGVGFNPAVEVIVNKEFEGVVKNGTGKSPASRIEQISYKPNELIYHFSSDKDEIVVFSEIYYPNGWTAKIDNTPIEIFRANYLLRGLSVPAGEHTITFEYSSKPYAVGGIVSLISSLLILIGLGLIGFLAYKKDKRILTGNDSVLEL